MDYVFGIAQALAVIGIVWVKISDLGKRVDRLEKRLDDFLNGKSK